MPDEFDDKERPTGSICAACAGEGRVLVEEGSYYRSRRCKWCTGGVQTAEQLAAWKRRQR